MHIMGVRFRDRVRPRLRRRLLFVFSCPVVLALTAWQQALAEVEAEVEPPAQNVGGDGGGSGGDDPVQVCWENGGLGVSV